MKILAILFLTKTVVFSQTFVFGESAAYTTTAPNKYLAIWAQQGIKGKIGVFGWGEIFSKTSDGNYKQVYGGLSYQLSKELQVGTGFGVQNSTEKFRFANFGYYEKGPYSDFFVIEDSRKEKPFIFNQFNRRIGKSRFGVGSLLYSPVGLGPRFETNISCFKLYVSPMYGPKNGANLFFGIRWIYSK